MNPIDLIDAQLLSIAAPETPAAELAAWVQPIKEACKRFEIDRVRRIAAFLGQFAHESSFRTHEENLNYSAKRLTQVWPLRFPTMEIARQYERNPEKLANFVYANRMGNGPPASGDGWRFRGAGLPQLTGRSNYTRFADAMEMTIDAALAYIRTIEGSVMAAAWFWEENDINRLADTPGVEDESRRINGGTHGLADRRARFDRLVRELLRRGA